MNPQPTCNGAGYRVLLGRSHPSGILEQEIRALSLDDVLQGNLSSDVLPLVCAG